MSGEIRRVLGDAEGPHTRVLAVDAFSFVPARQRRLLPLALLAVSLQAAGAEGLRLLGAADAGTPSGGVALLDRAELEELLTALASPVETTDPVGWTAVRLVFDVNGNIPPLCSDAEPADLVLVVAPSADGFQWRVEDGDASPVAGFRLSAESVSAMMDLTAPLLLSGSVLTEVVGRLRDRTDLDLVATATHLHRPRPDVGPYVAPRDELEEQVAAIWARALDLETVGVDDDFFELGGHSLVAAEVVRQLRRVLGVEFPAQAMYLDPTVTGLVDQVRAGRFARARPSSESR